MVSTVIRQSSISFNTIPLPNVTAAVADGDAGYAFRKPSWRSAIRYQRAKIPVAVKLIADRNPDEVEALPLKEGKTVTADCRREQPSAAPAAVANWRGNGLPADGSGATWRLAGACWTKRAFRRKKSLSRQNKEDLTTGKTAW